MDRRAFNAATALGRRDVLRMPAARLADWWLPRRAFAQRSSRFRKASLGFGVRHKFRPFSSMLLFLQPRASEQAPLIEDPAGSFVDVEQLSYYIWLNAEKSPAYRKHTLYLFLAEGVGEMLAIRSDLPVAATRAPVPATLADVCATMAHWLGVPPPDPSARTIPSLVG